MDIMEGKLERRIREIQSDNCIINVKTCGNKAVLIYENDELKKHRRIVVEVFNFIDEEKSFKVERNKLAKTAFFVQKGDKLVLNNGEVINTNYEPENKILEIDDLKTNLGPNIYRLMGAEQYGKWIYYQTMDNETLTRVNTEDFSLDSEVLKVANGHSKIHKESMFFHNDKIYLRKKLLKRNENGLYVAKKSAHSTTISSLFNMSTNHRVGANISGDSSNGDIMILEQYATDKVRLHILNESTKKETSIELKNRVDLSTELFAVGDSSVLLKTPENKLIAINSKVYDKNGKRVNKYTEDIVAENLADGDQLVVMQDMNNGKIKELLLVGPRNIRSIKHEAIDRVTNMGPRLWDIDTSIDL